MMGRKEKPSTCFLTAINAYVNYLHQSGHWLTQTHGSFGMILIWIFDIDGIIDR